VANRIKVKKPVTNALKYWPTTSTGSSQELKSTEMLSWPLHIATNYFKIRQISEKTICSKKNKK
jgi:hypothetical protein